MDTLQQIWAIFLIPFFSVYGSYEFVHGIKSLKYKQFHTNPAIEIRIWIMRMTKGDQAANEYKLVCQNNQELIAWRGLNSILFGIVSWVVVIIWSLFLFGVSR